MKTWMVIILGLGVISLSKAQDLRQDQVPSVVLNAFQTKYPKATDVDWELKGELYEVDFEIDRTDYDVWIDKSGTIKKQKEDFPKAQLPAAVTEKIKTGFKDYQIDDVDRIEENGKVYFLVDLDGKPDDREVLFSENGTVEDNRVD